MKVIVFIKANEESEAGVLPSEELLNEMGKYNEALVKAGIMLNGEGLKSSSEGKLVIFKGKDRTVVDGPFPDSKNSVAGFWTWNVKSMDEAVEWVKRMPNPMNAESQVEIRPIFEAEDFGEAYTPEARERDERLRKQLEKK